MTFQNTIKKKNILKESRKRNQVTYKDQKIEDIKFLKIRPRKPEINGVITLKFR